MFEKLIDLHNLREKCNKANYTEKQELILQFIKKYKNEFKELCRYLFYIEYLYCKNPKRRLYKKSKQYQKDRQIAYDILYWGFPCKNCGKQAKAFYIPKSKNLLKTPLYPYCSIECKRAYSAHAGTEGLKQLSEEEKKRIKEKAIQTMLKRYGVRGTLANKQLAEKVRKTMKERYGVENCTQNKKIKQKGTDTFKKNYSLGSEARKEMLAKRRKACLERYGTEIPGQNKEIKKRIIENLKNRSQEDKRKTLEKRRKTCLAKYGVSNYSKLDSARKNLREKILKRRVEGNISFARSKIYTIAGKEIECQSKNEYEFAKWLVITKGYDRKNIISQYDPEYDDFIFEKIKTFPAFYLKDKDIYIEVKSPYTFFGTSIETEYSEEKLKKIKEKAKRANINTGVIVRWVVCNKLPNHIWHFVLLPKNWWEYSLEYFVQLFKEKKIL